MPDVFILLIPKQFDGVSIQPFLTPWGETDVQLCSFGGTLIGQVVPDDRLRETTVIALLPKLDRRRDYPFPSRPAFLQALVTLLRSAPNVRLICERDAEQETVQRLASPDLVEAALDRVMAYCEGQRPDCPSFSYGCP